MEGNTILTNEKIQKTMVLVLIFLAAFLAVKTINEIKEYRYIGGGVPTSNVVTVSGMGEVFAVPDIATFSFSVIEEKETATEAQEQAAKKINKILSFLKKSDIKEKDIKTTNYNVYPRYEYKREICTGGYCPPGGERVLVGFEVNQTISVKVRNTDDAGEIVSGVGELGVSNISGLNFTIDDEEELLKEARKKAINDAQEKAKDLAKDLGVKLIRVVSFSDFGGEPYYPKYDFAETTVLVGQGRGVVAPELPVGENKIISRVNITYEIR